jgi:Protein of unknown function (DUF3105)
MVYAVNVRFVIPAAAAALSLFSMVACGDDEGSTNQPTDGGGSGEAAAPKCAPTPPPQKPSASCDVTIESPPESGANNHVPEGTQLAYCSNPPSSGTHYPVWAAFQEYSAPVPWPYLVHSLEHGAVALFYKCDGACPEVVEQLRKVRDNAAADPACAAGTKRIIIAPSDSIPTKVAAAAWGKTYQAACVDMPTLEAFVRDNYAKTVENICNPGRTF